jgi:hypothetical protein
MVMMQPPLMECLSRLRASVCGRPKDGQGAWVTVQPPPIIGCGSRETVHPPAMGCVPRAMRRGDDWVWSCSMVRAGWRCLEKMDWGEGGRTGWVCATGD